MQGRSGLAFPISRAAWGQLLCCLWRVPFVPTETGENKCREARRNVGLKQNRAKLLGRVVIQPSTLPAFTWEKVSSAGWLHYIFGLGELVLKVKLS